MTEYSKIIAVTGLPGLHELLSSKTDGAIVRSLEDKSTRFVSSRIHSFSHLESIEVYTVRENVNLIDILKAMEGSSENLPDEKDPEGLKKYFQKTVPDLDFDRVYSSDLKKMVKWFSILKTNNIELKVTKAEPVVAEKEKPREEEVVKNEPVKPKEKKPVSTKKELKEEKEESAPRAKKTVKKKKEVTKKDPPAKKVAEKEKPKKAAPKKKSAK